MTKVVNMIGQTFGRLKVNFRVKNDKYGKAQWSCLCSCGSVVIVMGCHLRSGNTASCGCLSAEKTSDRSITHGLRGHPLYGLWSNMKQRCSNPRHQDYISYGGRGIRVCPDWIDSFPKFLADMGDRPTPKHSIDRKDNSGNYTANNCKWATHKEQMANRRPSSEWNQKTIIKEDLNA